MFHNATSKISFWCLAEIEIAEPAGQVGVKRLMPNIRGFKKLG